MPASGYSLSCRMARGSLQTASVAKYKEDCTFSIANRTKDQEQHEVLSIVPPSGKTVLPTERQTNPF